jgi:hypothetical protein
MPQPGHLSITGTFISHITLLGVHSSTLPSIHPNWRINAEASERLATDVGEHEFFSVRLPSRN